MNTPRFTFHKATRGLALVLAAAAGGLVLAYPRVIRPWQERWGATDDEAPRSLPGDDVLPPASAETTQAITIQAPRDAIWPWLAQLGQGRGGLYSYGMRSAQVYAKMRGG